MSCHHWAAELTCSYLQSLGLDFFDAFYSSPVVTRDCVLHTRDDSPGMPFDIHGPVAAYARASDDSDIFDDRMDL